MAKALPRTKRSVMSVEQVIKAINEACKSEQHKRVLKIISYLADALGCKLHMEPKRQDSKVIVTYKGNVIFALRSVASGLWADFLDPDNTLTLPRYLKLIRPLSQTPAQHPRYSLNKTAYFDANALGEACILLAHCYHTRQRMQNI